MSASISNSSMTKEKKGKRKRLRSRAWALGSTRQNIWSQKSPAMKTLLGGGEGAGPHASQSPAVASSSRTAKNTSRKWDTKKHIKSSTSVRSHTSSPRTSRRKTNRKARYIERMIIMSTQKNRIQKSYINVTRAILRLLDITQATSTSTLHLMNQWLRGSQTSITLDCMFPTTRPLMILKSKGSECQRTAHVGDHSRQHTLMALSVLAIFNHIGNKDNRWLNKHL